MKRRVLHLDIQGCGDATWKKWREISLENEEDKQL
jgi:hypothetical protein